MSMDRYDAIVVGGGHNGLVNGAYLAKAGLKTLILERRHVVGGAAITEELWPGFQFTTFSYALSLLRPQIIQELELTKHGFLPLLMATRFAPGEDGEYLLFNRDHDETLREIGRLSPHDADAYEQYGHDLDRVCQAIKPLLDTVPPDLFSDDPEELVALAALARRAAASSSCSTRSASTMASSAAGPSTRAATVDSPRCWRERPSHSAPRSGSRPPSSAS
jgi:phytoene dehydrogenase-like protein